MKLTGRLKQAVDALVYKNPQLRNTPEVTRVYANIDLIDAAHQQYQADIGKGFTELRKLVNITPQIVQ